MSHRPGQDRPDRPCRVLVGLLVAASLALLCSAPTQAAQYRVRSLTLGEATQYFRADHTVSAPRLFTQGLSLWGYDLLGDHSGSVNLHVSFRYHTDFSLERAQRDDPYLADQWNEVRLDLAYVDWKPFDAMRLRFGRQWALGSLGARDFDGVALRWRPRVEASTHARVKLYAGRDVQTAYGRFDPARFDVQGLPPNEQVEAEKLEGTHFLSGAGAGMRWGRDASFELNWRRRFSTGVDSALGQETVVGSERFGAAATASFTRRLVATAHGSVHSQLGSVDRAGAQLSFAAPGPAGTATVGVDHRHPWFDSSSIFNLFGARPYQGGFAVYRQPVDSLRTHVELRGWGRVYRGDADATAAGVEPRGERTAGAAISHTTRLRLWQRSVNWRSLVSYQSSLERGSEQLLGDVRVRMPLWRRDLFVSARGLALAAVGDHRRLGDGYATTAVAGVDIPVSSLGTLSAAVETTAGSFYPTNTSVYAAFALEHWP